MRRLRTRKRTAVRTATFLGVDSHEVEVVPNGGEKAVVEIELETGSNDHRVWTPGQLVHFLDRKLIDLVVDLQRPRGMSTTSLPTCPPSYVRIGT